MRPPRLLQTWLGRAQRPLHSLRLESLEDRITPAVSDKLLAAPVDLSLLPTTQDLLALTSSAQPLADLANLTNHLGLQNVINVGASSRVLETSGFSLVQVRLHDGVPVRAAAAALQATGLYAYVAPNYIYPPGLTGRSLVETIPNDPLFASQYHHAIINTPAAWNVTFGSSMVTVAILDDGLDLAHPDLAGNLWTNLSEIAGDGLDNDGNGLVDDRHGWDFVGNSPNVFPDSPVQDQHGTQMAGVLAARINNGLGLAGVAGLASIMPLKVIGAGATTSLTLARAVNYAVQHGAKIINSSINIDPFVHDPTFRLAVSQAYNSGLLWVNSAGNLNLQDPARAQLDEMLIVGATDRFDAKTLYSNYGWGLDLMAPGGSAADPFATTIPGGYGSAWGTSVAAPLVAGTAALLWAANPHWTRDQVVNALLTSTDGLEAANPGLLDRLGTGRLNAGQALSGGPFVTRLGRVHGMPATGEQVPADFSSFQIRLGGNLDPNTVQLSNFELRWAGPDNTFDSGDDQLIPLALQGDYKYGTNSLNFQIASSLGEGLYRFTAYAGGLRDPFGVPVDGNGDGQSGGNLVRFFGRPIVAQGKITLDIFNGGGGGGGAGGGGSGSGGGGGGGGVGGGGGGGGGGTNPPSPGVPGAGVYPDFNNNGQWDIASFPSTTAPQVIADHPAQPAVIQIPISGFTRPVNYLSVMVELVHPSPSDLVIKLIAPTGQAVVLFANRPVPLGPPAATQLFQFADEAVESTTITESLVTRILKPDQSLSQLYGLSANGVWRVEVRDVTPGDEGLLISAALTIGEEPLFLTDADGRFVIDHLPLEPVVLRIVPPPGMEVRGVDKNPGMPVGTARNQPVNFSLELVPTEGIIGRVTDQQGGVGGFTMYLDSNNNGRLDAGETVAVSEPTGFFQFRGLPPGSYDLRILNRPGYTLTTQHRNAVLTAAQPLSAGHEFQVVRDTGRVAVTLAAITPAIRNTPVGSVDFTLSEALPGLKLSDLILARDGMVVPLAGATLLGQGTAYSLVGLAEKTAQNGTYTLTVLAPAPPGQPDRQPWPIAVSWTFDSTPPTAVLEAVADAQGRVNTVNIQFSKPVSGLDLTDFVLRRDGHIVPFTPVTLTSVPGANRFVLSNLTQAAAEPGHYTLTLLAAGSGITDLAGNSLLPTAPVEWQVLPPPVRYSAIGSGVGMPPTVQIYDAAGKLVRSFMPYEATYTGGVRVAVGDVNGDQVDDIIVAPGRNAGPRVRIFDGKTGTVIQDLFVFEPTFRGGVNLAAGDLTGDGRAELIVAPDRGGGPRVRVLHPLTGATVADFFGIQDVNFRGGVRCTVGDVTGDGRLDLIVAAGIGGGPRIAVFDGPSVALNAPVKPFGDFLAFEPHLRNGAHLTAMDLNGDGYAEIITGAGDGGGPRVSAFSGQQLMQHAVVRLADFFAGPVNHRGGVRLAAHHSGDGEPGRLAVGLGTGGGQVRIFAASSLLSTTIPDPVQTFEPFGSFHGGVYLG